MEKSENEKDSKIGLADAIENLRQELTEATRRGERESLRFTVKAIELEVAVNIVREGGGDGKVSFKVLGLGAEVGGKGGLAKSDAHRVKITLTPADTGYQVSDTEYRRERESSDAERRG